MKTIRMVNSSPSERQLTEIAELLEEGKIGIIPTDTLYAIVCDTLNSKAIERLCKIKGINPEKNNLSILCSDISMAAEYAKIDNKAFRIIKEATQENEEKAYTYLLPATRKLPKAFKGRKTVGIRIPNNNITLAIVERLGRPLFTTSIEYEDEDYAREPSLIAETYDDKVDYIVEGEEGRTTTSTIIDLSNP
ncbi:MAG: L-threonylcarbamoyladenylate synthase [Clostridium sp.]|nr:L-threonylcarbamoyladenylate synthase [Bacteroides sp.]MCM1377672.1 L-threonylcarbamoyladenylate synthase [Prevotella sp.]MCM1428201.1 L-threonylcarbamoyladenylate synthase [Clostridium sp.]MCM1475932.1 L-threonylcarbamoyladenylate synthase [Muribaculaceae bacterium]